MPAFSEIVEKAFHAKRPYLKRMVYVPLRYKRDEHGRFAGIAQSAYWRPVYDKKRLVSNMELLAENITANNALLRNLCKRGVYA